MYFGTCQNWDDIRRVFEYSKYKPCGWEPDVLFCFTSNLDYEGHIYLLFREKDRIMMVDSGWCSCGGPDWLPEESSLAAIRYIMDRGTHFHSKIFEYYGYETYGAFPYSSYNDALNLDTFIYHHHDDNVLIGAYIYLDNLLSQMGHPPSEKRIAAITGNSQTIWEISEVFPDVDIQHLVQTSVIRADMNTINQIRSVCPDIVILTFQEAVGQP